MALPPGSSPIQTAVLQLSRDLQQAFSKAKTSLSAVATTTAATTQTTRASTSHHHHNTGGSDSALPTTSSREGIIFKRNSGSENAITSSSFLAALDLSRTPSRSIITTTTTAAASSPSLADKSEEESNNAQPAAEENPVVLPGSEASPATITTTARFRNCDDDASTRDDAFCTTGPRWAPPSVVLSVPLEAEKAEAKVESMNKHDGGEENTKRHSTRKEMGRCHSENSHNDVFFSPSSAPSVLGGNVTGESILATKQSVSDSLRANYKTFPTRKDHCNSSSSSTTISTSTIPPKWWLHFASPGGVSSVPSSSFLVAQRGSNNTVSSPTSSVCSLSSSFPTTPTAGVVEPAAALPGARLPSSSLLFAAGDLREEDDDDLHYYRRASIGGHGSGVGGSSSSQSCRDTTTRQQHFHRKKLTSTRLACCCSTGSSPCRPPLLPAAASLLLSPYQQQNVEKSLLSAHDGGGCRTEKEEAVACAYASHSSSFNTGRSYTSMANPANSRLAEVENSWFFVDILGDNVPSLIEEIPSQQPQQPPQPKQPQPPQQQCFSPRTDAAVDGTVADIIQQHTQDRYLSLTGSGFSPSLQEANRNSSNSSSSSDAVYIPSSERLLHMDIGGSARNDEDMQFRRCMFPAENVEVYFGSGAEDHEQVSDTRLSPSNVKKEESEDSSVGHSVKPVTNEQQQEHETLESEKKLREDSHVVPHEQVIDGLHNAGRAQHREEVQHEQQQQQVKEERIQHHSHKACVPEAENVEALSGGAAEVMTRSGNKLSILHCSDRCIAGAAMSVTNSPACSSQSTAASSALSKYQSQHPLLQLGLCDSHRLEFLPDSQLLHQYQRQQQEAGVRQRDREQQRQQVVADGNVFGEDAALLGTDYRSSIERSSGYNETPGRRRRHRMQKAEGTTSFASLEAMVEFVRNSTSLYGTAALEGVTFHVPAEDAEALVSALEETLPYSWTDLRSAAFNALKPLTALVVGRFVLLQLPSLLLEVAGGTAAKNAAAAAAAAAAEASGLSAVLAIAPWLIVFGGCVYAIVRGAHALQASRRAQFIIYEDRDTEASRSQQQCENTVAVSLPDCLDSLVVDTPAAATLSQSRTTAAVPAGLLHAADALREEVVSADVLQLASAHAGTAAAATQTSQLAVTENIREALGELSDTESSEGSDREEKHPLLGHCEAEEQTKDVVSWTSSASRGCDESRGSRRSSSIVDLLSVAPSRRNSEEYGKCDAVATGEHTNEDTEDNMYLKLNDAIERDGGGDSGVSTASRSDADGLSQKTRRHRRSSTTTTSAILLHKRDSSGRDDDLLQSRNSSERTNEKIKVPGPRPSHTESSNCIAESFSNTSGVTGTPRATAAVAEDYITVCRDRNRRLQEEEALQQQLLTCCSSGWREKHFPFEV